MIITPSKSYFLISFLCGMVAVTYAGPGFCVYHYPDWYSGAQVDEYVFYAYTTGVSNSSYYDPDPSLLESEVCRITPVSLQQEIGAGSLIAPGMVNSCESVCDLLLADVRSRISRNGCTYSADLSQQFACEYARDRYVLRPPPPGNTGTGSGTGGSPPGPGDDDMGPGNPGPGTDTGVPGSTTSPFSAFGPNNSTTLACGSGPGSSYDGDNFCRGVCGDLVEQVLIRLRSGSPISDDSFGTLVGLWSYAQAWNNCP